jgi:DNA-binding NarL/FixJ family response regulator
MISVAIVDDHRDIREGLQNILNTAEGFRCVGTYGDAESAIEGILDIQPDVVLMDVDLPEMSGIECVKILKRALPELNVIMLTDYTEDKYIFQSLRAGAYGYLSKSIFPSKLLNAIREVHQGGAPMDAHIARRVVTSFNKIRNAIPDLSDRERDVLYLLCEGRSYKDMAKKLFVSPNTIRFHLKNIYKKLDVNSRHEAVIKASRVGIT